MSRTPAERIFSRARTGDQRLLAIVTVAVSLGTALTLDRPLAAQTERRPNFVIIMADDLGYGDLSSYDGWISTPNLDRLADDGLRFTDFHSSGNVCSPTRAGLVTGRYQQRAGIPGVVYADPKRDVHYHGLQQNEITFANVLGEAGYATALFGKWHLGYEPQYNPIHRGFDRFRGYVSGNVDFFSHVDQAGVFDWWNQDRLEDDAGYTTHLITRYSVDFIRQQRDRPFCLYVAHEAPHYPYQGPHDQAERSAGTAFRTEGSTDDIQRTYREMVQEMDRGIGDIRRVLEELELSQHTLVLFFSDNGANKNGSNGPLRGAKGSDWEGGHRVPCLAWWPGKIAAGRRTDQLAITLDVMPTLLDAAGITPPKSRPLDGMSLLPVLTGKSEPVERQLFWNGQAVRRGHWKLIRNAKGLNGVGLFDLNTDLGEQHNVAGQHPALVTELTAALDAWQRDVATGATAQPVGRARQSPRP